MNNEKPTLQREVPESWNTNYFFLVAIDRLKFILQKISADSGKQIYPSKVNIIDIGGGAEQNNDWPDDLTEDEVRFLAEQQGLTYEVYKSGYEPWLLRAAWALGIGDEGLRLNLEIQPQTEADKARFKQLNVNFVDLLLEDNLVRVLRLQNVLPKNGFEIISCRNVFRENPLTSSPAMIRAATKGKYNPRPEKVIASVDKVKEGFFRAIIDPQIRSGFVNSDTVFNLDPFLEKGLHEYLQKRFKPRES